MNKKIFSAVLVLFVFLISPNVNALTFENNMVSTQNGVKMTFNQYNEIRKSYNDTQIDTMNKDLLKAMINNDETLISSETIYVITDTITDSKGNVISHMEREVSEEEMNNLLKQEENITKDDPQNTNNWVHNTTYKQLLI